MPKRPACFTQAEIKRAIAAVTSAGMTVARIEIEPAAGKVNVVAGVPENAAPSAPLEGWLSKRNAR